MAAVAANQLTRLIAIGFISGALAILAFHQPTIALLQLIDGRPVTVYGTRAIPPFAVPSILNAMFWGGLWGIVYLWLARHFRGRFPAWLVGLVAGAVLTVLVGWFIVAPLKGQAIAQGFNWPTMWRSPVIHGMFGLGSALLAGWLEKRM